MYISDKKLLNIKCEDIKPSPNQARKTFDEYELKLLADSILSNGIIQPVSVRRLSDGSYEIIAGERRFRAAKMAGFKKIPCIVHKTDDNTAALYTITENLQRSNLTFFEEAEGISRLINECGMTQVEVSERLGLSQSALSNKLRILRLSQPLRERILSSRLTERHARALLRIPNESRAAALNHIIANALTVAQTDEYITECLSPKTQKKPLEKPIRKAAIGDVRLFSNSLTKLVNTLQSAGIDAKTRRFESEKYIEYKVRIKKEQLPEQKCIQLKIC